MNQATREYVQRKLDTHFVPEPMSGCWLWPRSVDASGYGKVGEQGQTLLSGEDDNLPVDFDPRRAEEKERELHRKLELGMRIAK